MSLVKSLVDPHPNLVTLESCRFLGPLQLLSYISSLIDNSYMLQLPLHYFQETTIPIPKGFVDSVAAITSNSWRTKK